MGGVDEDEEGEVVFSDEVLRAMPVATEMGELGPEDMQVNGLDISQQQILLARGYRVFLTRGQLYEVQIAARETTKTPWSVCVRRLMDIYFDRQTLAMGKATSHGFSNNPARKTLNQEVIQAIKAYTSSVYDEALTSIQRAMTYYVCNIRKSLRLEQSNYASVEPFQNSLILPDAVERQGRPTTANL
ncbi:nucleus accumbens-associated protein 1-like isoform X1 [Amphiura filiformis]|uniref:nucleus accumbens-associated protein 1-like isoform X1 n=1 Tax=Amphiura filiformis TaxID=82378 RepID=UPI003B219260